MERYVEVYLKWKSAKELGGKFITKLKVLESSSIADLRKLIEAYLGDENKKQQAISFLMLGGDPTGAPLAIGKEMATPVSKLPICNNQLHGHLVSLRAIKKLIQRPDHLPFSPLENKLPAVKQDEFFSPRKGERLSPLLNPLSGIRV